MIKILVIAFTCFNLHENTYLCGNVASDKIVVEASEVKFLVIDDTLDKVDLVWIVEGGIVVVVAANKIIQSLRNQLN